jgi:hypothetical protein
MNDNMITVHIDKMIICCQLCLRKTPDTVGKVRICKFVQKHFSDYTPHNFKFKAGALPISRCDSGDTKICGSIGFRL